MLVYQAQEKLATTHLEIADRITGENRGPAMKAAEEASQADFVANAIDGERDIINFDYWLKRCQIEPQDVTLEARKKVYDANAAFAAAQLVKSRDLYNEGLAKWRKVLDAHPTLMEDAYIIEELAYSIGHYNSVLHQLDEKFPEKFTLQDVLDANERFTGRAYPGAPVSRPDSADPSQRPGEGSQDASPSPSPAPQGP
jgi:hypothetical protein